MIGPIWGEHLGGSAGKESACDAENPGSIPGLGRSHGEGNGNPLQYSCLKNSVDRGAWGGGGAAVCGSQRVGHACVTNTLPLKENWAFAK